MDKKMLARPLQHSSSAADNQTEVPAFLPLLAGCLHLLPKLPAGRFVAAGTVLLEQGCVYGGVHLVASGLVKLEHLSVHGRQTTIGLRSDGWYAGSVAALLNLPSVYSVRTVTDCMVVKISGAAFSRALKDCPEVLNHFLRGLCFEVVSQATLNAEVMAASAEERLDHFMREREDSRTYHGTFDPMPMLKQMDLAQLLSVTPEHLSRLMSRRRSASPSGMVLKAPELRAMAEQTFS